MPTTSDLSDGDHSAGDHSAGDRAATEPSAGAGERTAGAPQHTIALSLRRARERAGLSVSELAKRAGVAKSTLSQLESASGNPSVETLWALGVALDVPFSRLVDPPRPPIQVIRSGEGPAIYSERADYTATLLASCPPNARRDIYVITAEPGAEHRSDPHMPGTVEHAVVSQGRALLGPRDEPVELGPGDYCSYAGDLPHVFEALETSTAAVMVMEHV